MVYRQQWLHLGKAIPGGLKMAAGGEKDSRMEQDDGGLAEGLYRELGAQKSTRSLSGTRGRGKCQYKIKANKRCKN